MEGVRNKPGRFRKLIFVLQFFFSRLAKFEMTVESANEGLCQKLAEV